MSWWLAMRNIEKLTHEISRDDIVTSSRHSLDRFPICAPTQERAIETARRFLHIFQAGLSDEDYAALIESAWRAARGPLRWILVGSSKQELQRALEDFIFEGHCAAFGTRHITPRRVVFVFSGMGPQWSGMGRKMAENNIRFAEYVAEINELFMRCCGVSVWEELCQYKDEEQLPTSLAQTGNFLIQAALYQVLVDENIVPDAILGHSAGEVAAAFAAGVYSLEDAVRLANIRGNLQATLEGRGSMLAVGASRKEVTKLIAEIPDVSIAAINDDNGVTISGSSAEIEKLEKLLNNSQVFAKKLRVNVPYHSPVMEEIIHPITSQLSFLKPSSAETTLYSTVSGECSDGREWGAGYWACNVRQPVLFADAVKEALSDGVNCFVEIAPHPVLSQSISDLASDYSDISVHHLLSRKTNEYESFVSKICELAIDRVGRPKRTNSAPLLTPVAVPQKLWDEDPEIESERRGDWFSEEMRLLGRAISSSAPRYELELSTTDYPWLTGHSVQGLGAIVPATLWAELMSLAISEGVNKQVQMTDLTIVQSLPVTSTPTIVSTQLEGGLVRCMSRQVGKPTLWTLHAQATISLNADLHDDEDVSAATKTLPPTKGKQVDSDQLYQIFHTKGLDYNDHFHNLSNVTIGERYEAWATIDGKALYRGGQHSPWVLDAGLQLLIAASKDWSEMMYLPYLIRHVNLLRPMIEAGSYQAHAEVIVRNNSELIGTVSYYDMRGILLAELREITCIRNQSDDIERGNYIDKNTYTIRKYTLEEVAELNDKNDRENEALEKDKQIIIPAVSELFDEQIEECWVVEGDDSIEHEALPFERPFKNLNTITEDSKVHLLWILPDQDLKSNVLATTRLIQRLGQYGYRTLTLTLIANQGQDWVFGLRRSAANSYGFSIRVIVRDETTTNLMLQAAVALVHEHEIVFQGDEPLLGRLEKVTGHHLRSPDTFDYASKQREKDTILAFDFVRGQLNKLVPLQEPLRKPGPGEVCIEVEAIGLMWKDIGKILGTIGTSLIHTFAGNHVGFGISGRVVEVGTGAQLAVGEKIFGGVRRPYRSRVTLTADEARSLRRVPNNIEGVTAIAHAVPWMTSLAVFHRAKPQPGEKIFIQSGAGSVGSILCLYAQQLGAQVVTSVGSTNKVVVVKKLVPDAEVVVARGAEIPEALNCAGYRSFDWIVATVNGLARPALMTLLNHRGHYIDIGKPGSYNESFLVNLFDGNRSYHVIDIDQLSARVPGWLDHQLDLLVEKLSDNANLAPVTTYPINEMPTALSKLAQGETTGCVAIEMVANYQPQAAHTISHSLNPGGVYIITGGYGAVGLVCARWLVSRGARRIVLSGSSGNPNKASQAGIDLLRAGGADVKVVKSDITDRQSVIDMVSQIKKEAGVIHGIIHAAGMISDGPFDEIGAERIERSFGAKLEGSYHMADALDAVDGFTDLDFFLLTSSISSVVGLSIQGTYASANAGLDRFAEDLRRRGVNACAVQLGPIDQSGMAADETVKRYYTTIGLMSMSTRRLYGILDMAIAVNVPSFVTDEVDWARNSRAEPANASSSLLRHIITAALSDRGNAELENLLSLDHNERTEVITMTLLGIFTDALGLDEGRLVADSNFSAMGIDSLAIMEVQAGINEVLQQDLPLARMFTQDGTISDMASRISEYLGENVSKSSEAA
jgi:acyl transferase domain-containing protein